MKHTPGPWRHSSYEGGWDCVKSEAHGEIIAKLVFNNPANARLIAAAPNLLEELEMLFVRSGVLMILEDDDRERIESVIKKAKGETS